MRRFLRDQSLTLVTLGFFLAFLTGQMLTGFQVYNAERAEAGEPRITYGSYLRSGHFIEATFENWESEFLQMGAYVLLTAFLIQRGSAESRDPDAPKDEREPPPGPDCDPHQLHVASMVPTVPPATEIPVSRLFTAMLLRTTVKLPFETLAAEPSLATRTPCQLLLNVFKTTRTGATKFG